MGFFQRLFVGPPRMELLEALLRLAPVEFKRAELAEEAGLAKGNTNRVFPTLERDGLVRRVRGGKQPTYRVDGDNAYIRLLFHLEAALELIEEHGPDSGAAQAAADAFRRRAAETVRAQGLGAEGRPASATEAA